MQTPIETREKKPHAGRCNQQPHKEARVQCLELVVRMIEALAPLLVLVIERSALSWPLFG